MMVNVHYSFYDRVKCVPMSLPRLRLKFLQFVLSSHRSVTGSMVNWISLVRLEKTVTVTFNCNWCLPNRVGKIDGSPMTNQSVYI